MTLMKKVDKPVSAKQTFSLLIWERIKKKTIKERSSVTKTLRKPKLPGLFIDNIKSTTAAGNNSYLSTYPIFYLLSVKQLVIIL